MRILMMKSNFEIKINKEIRDYTESIFFGLSLRQSIFSIFACAIACILYFSFSNTLGMEITSWLCMLGAAPFATLGFIRFQGMYAEEIFQTAIHSLLLSHTDLLNKPFNLYEILLQPHINEVRKESISHDKKLRKNQKIKQRED